MRKAACAILFLLPMIALADAWVSLNGDEITIALVDRVMVYESATQRFYASGRTLYDAGQDSWGYWAVRGDQYCSQWPPSDGWDCYDIRRNGDMLRFIAKDGSVTDGTYAD